MIPNQAAVMPQQQAVNPTLPAATAATAQAANPSAQKMQQMQVPILGEPLTANALATAPPNMQKQMLGERLYPAVAKYQPELAGKITGMLLEMDNSELLMLLESDQQMRQKIDE